MRLTNPPAATTEIVDAFGRTVRTVMFAAQLSASDLSLAGLAPGLYVVRSGGAARRLVVE